MLVTAVEIKKPEEKEDTSQIKGVSCLDVRQGTENEIIIPALLKPSALGVLAQGKDKHFYSKGAFNLVQLVLYLLKQTGPAHLFISSYSIAEESLATLKRYKEQGKILSVRFLIDNRVRTISPKPFDYLVKAFPGCYRCCALHAKVALVYNEHIRLSVVGSQNATNNPKLERGIVHASDDVFNFDYKILNDEFDAGTT